MVATEKLFELVLLAVTAAANSVTAYSIRVLYKTLGTQSTGLALQVKAYSDDYRWRQQNLSIEILKEWNENTSQVRDRVESFFRVHFGEPERGHYIKGMTEDFATRLYHCRHDANASEYSLREVRADVIRLLNYFEYISSAYEQAVLDRVIIDESLKAPIMIWYSDLSAFVDFITEWSGFHVWPPLQRLIYEWDPHPLRSNPRFGDFKLP